MKIFFLLPLIYSSLSFSKAFSPKMLADLAEERAPLIKAQMEGLSAAEGHISQARLISNPIFSVQSGGLKTGTQFGNVVDVTINQPIPWPGKRQAEIDSAKILEKISSTDLEESKLIVHHSVTLLSLELASLVELERHNSERKHRFSLIHRFLTSRPMASPLQVIEKNLIETQLRLIETQMFEIETKRKSVEQQLQKLSGEEAEIALNWNFEPVLPSRESFEALVENGTQFRRSKKIEELAINRIEQSKYFAKPDILVGLNYRQENVAPVNHFYHANFAIVIPIIDRGQHSVEVARANARKEEANKKLTLMNSNFAINRSYQVLESAYKSKQLFNIRSLNKIEHQFSDAEDAFKKGRINATTFLQTDTQIHESIDLAYESYIKYYTALSELNLLVGQKLDIQ